MEKISSLDLNVNELKEQAANIYNELSKLNLNTEGFFAQIKAFFMRILDALGL